MAKRRIEILALLLCICLCFVPWVAWSASTADAKEFIDIDAECSLTVCYSCEGKFFPGQTVTLYKIADVSTDFQYTLTPDFAPSGLILNGVRTNGEWNVIRATLETHILGDNIAPLLTATTDENGQAHFRLSPGLYLVGAVEAAQDDLACTFDSALIALPGLGPDDLWQYQIAVAAKPATLPPIDPDGQIEYKLVKLWRGDEAPTDRPQSINIEIYRNGELCEAVTLSEENNWSYSWTVPADGATWKVLERKVPIGYYMTVERREHTFVITNTRSDEPNPNPPQTGDTANVLLYSILLYASGFALIILGLTRKRNRYEETDPG